MSSNTSNYIVADAKRFSLDVHQLEQLGQKAIGAKDRAYCTLSVSVTQKYRGSRLSYSLSYLLLVFQCPVAIINSELLQPLIPLLDLDYNFLGISVDIPYQVHIPNLELEPLY